MGLPPIAWTSDNALVAAMRPKSNGSSTIGMKKSVVATKKARSGAIAARLASLPKPIVQRRDHARSRPAKSKPIRIWIHSGSSSARRRSAISVRRGEFGAPPAIAIGSLIGGLPKGNRMRNAIDGLVEREVQLPGATRQSVFDALVEFDVELFRRRARSRADERRKTYLHDRTARILLYFRHGFTSGSTTPADVRLISLIEALPKSAARSS